MVAENGHPREEQCSLIQVLGAAKSGKKSLVRELLGATSQQEPPELQDHGCWSNDSRCLWKLDTKYYTARINIAAVQLTDVQGAPIPLHPAAEAVVVVIDGGSSGTWAEASRWLDHTDLDHCETRLCILNKADLCDASCTPWVEDLQEWCLDNMFECIQVCCVDPVVDAALADGSEDSQGIARVVAALSAHMWSNMCMKDRNEARGTHAVSEEQATTAPAPLLPPVADAGLGSDGKGGDAVQESDVRDENTSALCSTARRAPEDVNLIPDDDGEEGGDEYAAMEALMAKLAGHREQIAHLPDEERRDRAAGFALQLMSMMGLDEDDC
mmetsp:Transcript_10497/g.29869  ORF Transcript_10497/g.29869 Transcript_10497/m.29869 type:complete len:327 (-) Transcript_10497:454-1434(-)